MGRRTELIHGLREQIATKLRNDIFVGRLISGERLSELRLVERFKVSRTPIREALQQLTHEGILEAKPNCGVRVAIESSNKIEDLVVSILRTIETFGLHSCFADLTEEDFQQWDEIIDRMAKACEKQDFKAIAELDLEFHFAIIQRTGSQELRAIWRTTVALVRSHFRDAKRKYPSPMHIHAEHAKILEVFRGGDREAAVKILGTNIG